MKNFFPSKFNFCSQNFLKRNSFLQIEKGGSKAYPDFISFKKFSWLIFLNSQLFLGDLAKLLREKNYFNIWRCLMLFLPLFSQKHKKFFISKKCSFFSFRGWRFLFWHIFVKKVYSLFFHNPLDAKVLREDDHLSSLFLDKKLLNQ